jgi:hypothetical protein
VSKRSTSRSIVPGVARSRGRCAGDHHRRLRAALATARDLADAGLRFVVAPLVANNNDVVVALDDRFVAALYPHIHGGTRLG